MTENELKTLQKASEILKGLCRESQSDCTECFLAKCTNAQCQIIDDLYCLVEDIKKYMNEKIDLYFRCFQAKDRRIYLFVKKTSKKDLPDGGEGWKENIMDAVAYAFSLLEINPFINRGYVLSALANEWMKDQTKEQYSIPDEESEADHA